MKKIVIFTQNTMASTVATRQILLKNHNYIIAIVIASQVRGDSIIDQFRVSYKLIMKSSIGFTFYKFVESYLHSALLSVHKFVRSKEYLSGKAASIVDLAKRYNIEVIKCNDLANEAFLERITQYRPDYIFCIVNQILKKNVFSTLGNKLLNAHGSYLPEYRGPAQYFWYLMDGAKQFGVTLHYMDTGMDTGEIIFRRRFKFNNRISAYRLHYLLGEQFGSAFNLFIKDYLNKARIKFFRQNDKKATQTHLPTKEDVANFKRKNLKLITIGDFVNCT